MIRVLVVDDSAPFRDGLRHLLRSVDDVEVCGVAADGAAAVEAVSRLQPDVVLMDLAMPGMNGIEATRRIAAAAPHVGVVAMTMLDGDDAVAEALRAGARGYLVKGAAQAEILDVVRGVNAGRAVIGVAVARQVGGLLQGGGPAFPELTARERDVLSALAAGATTPQVAARLGISEKTVRNNVSAVMTKLRVATRTEAVLRARAAGLGRDGWAPR